MGSQVCGVCSGAIPDDEPGDGSGHTAVCAEVVRVRSEQYRLALEKIRDMMGPKNRERFVMQGPRAFIDVYNVVEDALK
jgi:hypothetical protein